MPWKHNYLSRYSVTIILFTDTLITSSPTNLIKITSLTCSPLLTCHCADLPCHDIMSLCRSPMPWHHVTVQISHAMTPCHCADLPCHDYIALVLWYISLYIVLQDVDKCIAIMEDLEALPVNQVPLKKNPDIVKTIKMVIIIIIIIIIIIAYSFFDGQIWQERLS